MFYSTDQFLDLIKEKALKNSGGSHNWSGLYINNSNNKKMVFCGVILRFYLLTYLVGLDDGTVFAAENPIVTTSFEAS